MKKLIISIFLAGSLNCLAEDASSHKAHLVKPLLVQKHLANLDKEKHSLKNTKAVIELLRYHTNDPYLNSGEILIERDIPALGYLIKNYDSDIAPLLLEYALNLEDPLLRRRAVYCIERLTKSNIEVYMRNLLGADLKSTKFEKMIQSSLSEGDGMKNLSSKEVAIFELKKITFFFPSMPDVLYNLTAPE